MNDEDVDWTDIEFVAKVVAREFPQYSWSVWSTGEGELRDMRRGRPLARIWGDDGENWMARGDTAAQALKEALWKARVS